jgi:hypothetical protein
VSTESNAGPREKERASLFLLQQKMKISTCIMLTRFKFFSTHNKLHYADSFQKIKKKIMNLH